MGSSMRPWSVALLLLAAVLPSVGCKRFLRTFTPQPQQAVAPAYAIDEPPPLHTGGLGVTGPLAGSPARRRRQVVVPASVG